MKLKRIYEEVVKRGKEADPRGKEIERILKEKKEIYEKLEKKEKKYFDIDNINYNLHGISNDSEIFEG